MAEPKTRPTDIDVVSFIHTVENEQRKEDAFQLLEWFISITGQQPVMWGDSIIGFGQYRYANRDGREHTFFRSGFSPRKQNMSVYVGAGMSAYPELLDGLGKHSRSKACLYFTKLANVDETALKKLIRADLDTMNLRYPPTD
ncbi:DUF1801 domain-containing protein [Alteromonas sediminis]|uniref:DUF1801 domain-containing protein n=1 Tax=Alteromonas sediminis TaxID=2259342 RepID=A0A3N5Y9U9_9ALTE|nr:DUF1801 domain-containing protein [Alteromonas sediminis]RPJ65465.1 DUF1801 domain-containing protein [Alteromonas sediminis]